MTEDDVKKKARACRLVTWASGGIIMVGIWLGFPGPSLPPWVSVGGALLLGGSTILHPDWFVAAECLSARKEFPKEANRIARARLKFRIFGVFVVLLCAVWVCSWLVQ